MIKVGIIGGYCQLIEALQNSIKLAKRRTKKERRK